MWRRFLALLKKDFKLMLSGRFFLLALGSLILYSCYINFVYITWIRTYIRCISMIRSIRKVQRPLK